MAEKEQNHRIAWETTYLRARNSHHTLGQILGFASVIVCVTGAVIMAYLEQPWPASILGGFSIINLVREFVKRRKSNSKE